MARDDLGCMLHCTLSRWELCSKLLLLLLQPLARPKGVLLV